MAGGVEVHVTDRAIISALNTPGGAVFEWRDEKAQAVEAAAIGLAPVNNPANAMHRGGVVGTYKAAFDWNRTGSNGHRVRATIFNTSDHADIVELGRSASGGYERFSWTGHSPSGSISVHRRGTSGRAGQHVLERALGAVAL